MAERPDAYQAQPTYKAVLARVPPPVRRKCVVDLGGVLLVGDRERTSLTAEVAPSRWMRKEKTPIAAPLFGLPKSRGSPGPRPMLDEIREKIGAEIEQLVDELNILLPERIEKAVELGDLRENAEYKSALERQQFVQLRIGHLTQRLSELSKIDVTAMPIDRVGFGSRVEIHDVAMDEVANFTIVAGDFMDLDGGQVSMASPIGRGLLGARKGEEVTIELPMGERRFKVLDLVTLPEQLEVGKE